MSKKRFFLLVCISISAWFSHGLFAQEFVTRVLQTSSSGKTIMLDRGAWEEVKLNDFAVIIREVPKTLKNNKVVRELRPVAKLRSVKLFDTRSVWVVLEEIEKVDLKPGAKVFLITESELLRGKKELSLKRTTFVASKESVKKFTEEQMKRDNLNLAKKDENYRKSRVLHQAKSFYDKDIELIDIDTLEKNEGNRGLSRTSLFRSQYAEDFSYRKRLATFEKMVAHFVEKYSDLNFNRENFYAEQQREPLLDQFQKNSSKRTYFDQLLYEKAQDREAAKKLAEEFRQKGPQWSDEYSDEELSELVTRAGITTELIRQEEKVMSKYNGQYLFSFGLNLLDNENDLDPDNHQKNRYDLELGLEYYPFKKLDNFLSKFSLEGSFRRSVDGFESNYYNALIQDYSLSGFVNFYPFQTPTDVSRNIFFIGMGVRSGFAHLQIPSINEEGNYQLVSFPTLRTGLKYSFSHGYGARLSFTYEKINLMRIETNSATSQGLGDELSYVEGKMGLSLTKLF